MRAFRAKTYERGSLCWLRLPSAAIIIIIIISSSSSSDNIIDNYFAYLLLLWLITPRDEAEPSLRMPERFWHTYIGSSQRGVIIIT